MPATAVKASDGRLLANAPPNIGAGETPIVRRLCMLNPYGEIIPFPVQCL